MFRRIYLNIFFDQLHSNKKPENERNLRGTHFCVPKGGSGSFKTNIFIYRYQTLGQVAQQTMFSNHPQRP